MAAAKKRELEKAKLEEAKRLLLGLDRSVGIEQTLLLDR